MKKTTVLEKHGGYFLLYKKLLVSYKVKKIYSTRPVAH